MIVTNQSTTEIRQDRENKKQVKKSSDSFARLLDSHTKQQSESDQLARRSGKDELEKTQIAATIKPRVIAGAADRASDPPPRTNNEGVNGAQAPSAPAHIQKLDEELHQQIELHSVGGSTPAIDITFHSRTMAGLQVQIRQSKGKLTIRFLSSSASTSRLLSQHAPSLKESLESKGVAVHNIVIANRQSALASPRSSNAEA